MGTSTNGRTLFPVDVVSIGYNMLVTTLVSHNMSACLRAIRTIHTRIVHKLKSANGRVSVGDRKSRRKRSER